jgi:polyisoprenoid-binding protein YceI
MRRYLTIVIFILIALLAYGCANPAANKPKATVANVAPESSSTKLAGAETPHAISPDNSKIEFVAAKVTRSHQGSFKRFAGTLDFVPKYWPASQVTIDIETDSVVTDEDQLTAHLKTADFFDVAKYPKATFVSTKIEVMGRPTTKIEGNGGLEGPAGNDGTETLSVTGNFDLHGRKKSITFPATLTVALDSLSVNAEFSINRQDFGLVYPGKADDLIRDGVVIKLTLKVPRKL